MKIVIELAVFIAGLLVLGYISWGDKSLGWYVAFGIWGLVFGGTFRELFLGKR